MTTVRFEITGKTPLLMHKPTAIDPLHPATKAMAEITNKRAKDRTEDDHARLAELEWHAALYLAPGVADGPVVPTANILRAVVNGANDVANSRVAGHVRKALVAREAFAELAYEGPRDPRELYLDKRFVDRRAVKAGGGIMRTRPKFDRWALVTDFEVDTAKVDLVDLQAYVETAGKIFGLCDGRKIGFGRFDVEMHSG